jgi:hypothetical protein
MCMDDLSRPPEPSPNAYADDELSWCKTTIELLTNRLDGDQRAERKLPSTQRPLEKRKASQNADVEGARAAVGAGARAAAGAGTRAARRRRLWHARRRRRHRRRLWHKRLRLLWRRAPPAVEARGAAEEARGAEAPRGAAQPRAPTPTPPPPRRRKRQRKTRRKATMTARETTTTLSSQAGSALRQGTLA